MMDKLEMSPSGFTGPSRRWLWAVGIVATLLIGMVVVLYLGRIKAVYQLYWGQEQLRRLFYEDIGWSDAQSSIISLVATFLYAIALVPLSVWVWRLVAWRFTLRQAATAFSCWVLIYGTAPLVHALLGSDACFNQRTGEPLKWYAEDPSGTIILFDSGGYDTVRATQKLRVTPAICAAVRRQKVNGRPNRITADIHSIEFFNPNNGKAQVWFHKASDGSYVLFDATGFDPATGEKLMPITKDDVAEVMARIARKAEEVRRDVKEAQDRAAQEAQTTKKAAAAHQAEIMRLRAKEAQAKADSDRKATLETKQAAEIRSRAEREARTNSALPRRASSRPVLRSSDCNVSRPSGGQPDPCNINPPTPVARVGRAGWAQVNNANCWVWNPRPRTDDVVATFSGRCEAGFINGPGKVIWSYQGIFISWSEGTYHAGRRLDGPFAFGRPDGTEFRGNVVNGLATGYGRYVNKNGMVFQGVWNEGCFEQGWRVAWVVLTDSVESACIKHLKQRLQFHQ